MFSFTISAIYVMMFFAVLLRTSAILFTIPIIGSLQVPVKLKVAASFIFTLMLFPVVKIHTEHFPTNNLELALGVFNEVMLGVAIGFTAKLFLSALQFAGQFIGVEVGYGLANLVNPEESNQMSVVAELFYFVGLMLFIILNADHYFITTLADSFDKIPSFSSTLSNGFFQYLIKLSGDIFLIAAKISAPIFTILLILTLAVGILAKTSPQFNIFDISFPLRIFVGLIFTLIIVKFVFVLCDNFFGRELITQINTVIKFLSPKP